MKLKVRGTDKQKTLLYPTVGEQLDAMWKILENIQGPDDAEKVRNQIREVKSQLHKNK